MICFGVSPKEKADEISNLNLIRDIDGIMKMEALSIIK
jgi:hypothetical protein